MGILDKFKNKLGDTIEKAAKKHRIQPSSDANDKEETIMVALEETPVLPAPYAFEKEDLKDLDQLLSGSSFTDERHLWCGGFPNYKFNQNAKAANLLTGKKNLKFISVCEEQFLLLRLEKKQLFPYQIFDKDQVVSVRVDTKLLSKSLRIEFEKGLVFTIDVTENKQKVEAIKKLLK